MSVAVEVLAVAVSGGDEEERVACRGETAR